MNLAIIYHAYSNTLNLDKSLNSLLQQTDKNFELILCNDGATEQVTTILKKIPFTKLAKLFYWHSNQNVGHAITFNNVVTTTTAKYVYYMGSNITLNVDFVKSINSLIEQYKNADMFMFTANENTTISVKKFTSINSDLKFFISQSMKRSILSTSLLRENHIELEKNRYMPLLFMYQIFSKLNSCILIDKKLASFTKVQSYSYNLYDIFEANKILFDRYQKTTFFKKNQTIIKNLIILSIFRFFLVRVYESYGNSSTTKIALDRAKK
jgi:glycosyltransferase involved in cell wall biosynthesis